MITRILSATMIAAVLSAVPATAAHHETSNHAQTVCPISGKDIDKDVYVDHEGKRIYLCCPDCVEKATADAKKIVARLESEGIKLAKATVKQTLCPVMGGEINKELYSDHDGKRVYFCCAMCKPIFEKDPAKYIKEMEAKGIELEKVKKSE